MAVIRVILEYIKVFYIVFKYWFFDLLKLFKEKPLKNLNSETILITGAASGLGKGLAQRLAQFGATLILWDVDETNNTRLAEELNNLTKSKRIHAMKCDLTNRENIYACAEKVNQQIGNVTMIINNAGVVTGKSLTNCSDVSIQRTFDVNVLAHFWVLKAFLPSMLDNNNGHIVTVASGAGLTGASGLVDYCSSKFAAVGLHEALTQELFSMKKNRIKTTVVCPSFINTGMFEGVTTSVLFPWLQPEYVCDEIIKAIREEESLVLIPKVLRLGLFLKSIISTEAQIEAQRAIGLHHSMDTFVGRR